MGPNFICRSLKVQHLDGPEICRKTPTFIASARFARIAFELRFAILIRVRLVLESPNLGLVCKAFGSEERWLPTIASSQVTTQHPQHPNPHPNPKVPTIPLPSPCLHSKSQTLPPPAFQRPTPQLTYPTSTATHSTVCYCCCCCCCLLLILLLQLLNNYSKTTR